MNTLPILPPLDPNPYRLAFCHEECRKRYSARTAYRALEYDLFLSPVVAEDDVSPDYDSGVVASTVEGLAEHVPYMCKAVAPSTQHRTVKVDRPGPVPCACGKPWLFADVCPRCQNCNRPLPIIGRRCGSNVVVTAGFSYLNPCLHIANHSPTGFEWGYAGSGPTQLALAVLAHCVPGVVTGGSLAFYQDFKNAVIATLPADEAWLIYPADVKSWFADLYAGKTQSARARATFILEQAQGYGSIHRQRLWSRVARFVYFQDCARGARAAAQLADPSPSANMVAQAGELLPSLADEERRILAELDPRSAEEVIAELLQQPLFNEFMRKQAEDRG